MGASFVISLVLTDFPYSTIDKSLHIYLWYLSSTTDVLSNNFSRLGLFSSLFFGTFWFFWCVFWFPMPAPGIGHDAAVPCFKANLAASLLIKWPRRLVGLGWNWLLCLQNALSDERKCFPVDFCLFLSYVMSWGGRHACSWWIWAVKMCVVCC